ncbi:hypothetical protein Mkiyose1665_43260 [Mycobacterium kiyosense]|uniref:DUF2889 domain-containing protein n=2 Tax=Mycobacteriaceae TaxID=1762 RepID=A0A9P3QD59_9MYCO|nr:hypothetical protein IWGMT90018_33130 [Mycobacterium kiyosense]BDE13898.1 hypothetical protein MKCMC460_27580 [Mycobacterium sp. 20KCMC460]GLB86281.1 hypothetical protein SRL2020028_55370 [Mycobacterium kiyosense]GLB92834.1 hypothetical protein SRL2020130_56510 [Mycobacterium kiyosense]GLB98967.1 hypothetical protein SRL2020226_57430 [Mycobacterium kiyosense]
MRRTSTIDTHPGGPGESFAELRGRDAVGTEDGIAVVGQVQIRARLVDFVVDDIEPTPPDARLDALRGQRVSRGFRAKLGELLPDEVRKASLLHLLLDDWVGAALVSGYGIQHTAISLGIEQKMPPGVADRMTGICAGFAPEASVVGYARQHDVIPTGRGPVAPALAGLHEAEPLRARGMRRLRRLDTWPVGDGVVEFDAHFRDSHTDDDLVETIVHEYTVTGTLQESTRTVLSARADVRVLPWQECPGAVESAARIAGMTLTELRDRVRVEFVGTSTCTHLNDTLRAIADLDALLNLPIR